MKKKMSLNKITRSDLDDVKGGKVPYCPCACVPTDPGEGNTSLEDGYGVYIRYH